MANVRK
jgi:hypothetical protein